MAHDVKGNTSASITWSNTNSLEDVEVVKDGFVEEECYCCFSRSTVCVSHTPAFDIENHQVYVCTHAT